MLLNQVLVGSRLWQITIRSLIFDSFKKTLEDDASDFLRASSGDIDNLWQDFKSKRMK